MFRRICGLFIATLFISSLGAEPGPDFSLKDLSGREHNVKEYIGQGKWVVAAIWSADCPICRREIYHMTFFHEEHSKKNAMVLGVSIDGYANKDKARGFIEEQGLNFPNLIGEPADVSRFGGGAFIGTPTYYFFSPDGRFMKAHIGAITQEQTEALIHTLSSQAPKA